MDHFEERLSKLEQWRYTIDVERAKEEVDRKHIDKRFDALEAELKDIKSTARWLTYSVASAVIVYIVTFALNGGFSSIGFK